MPAHQQVGHSNYHACPESNGTTRGVYVGGGRGPRIAWSPKGTGTLTALHQKMYGYRTLADNTTPQDLLQYYVRAAKFSETGLVLQRKPFPCKALQYYNHYLSLY